MKRLQWLVIGSLMLIAAPSTFGGGPCAPASWQQRLATISSEGSLITFFPVCEIHTKKVTEYEEREEKQTKTVNGKDVIEVVKRKVPVTKEVQNCSVKWIRDQADWSDKCQVHEAGGKQIDMGALRARLKKPTLVIVSLAGTMIPPNVAAMLHPNTIVLVPPKSLIQQAPLPTAAAGAEVTIRRHSSFRLASFQDEPIYPGEKPPFDLPVVTSPSPSTFTATWRNPDQVTLTSKSENELTAKCVFQVSEGNKTVEKETQARHRFVNIQNVDYPAFSVSAVTVDGRKLSPEILQRYLQVERTVVVPSTEEKLDPFWLQNFRPVVVVMTVPQEVYDASAMPIVAMPATEAPIPPRAAPVAKRPLRTATSQELEQLLAAAGNADNELVTQLLNDGLNINQQNADGETALMRAAANGHNGYVETLITDHKADPSLRNKAGKTAAQLAREKGHDATADAIGKYQ